MYFCPIFMVVLFQGYSNGWIVDLRINGLFKVFQSYQDHCGGGGGGGGGGEGGGGGVIMKGCV